MQIHDLTDEAFSDVRNITYTVITEDYTSDYKNAHGTTRETMVKLQILIWLKENRGSSPYIDEIGIYFPDTNEIITDSTTTPLNLAYHNNYRYTFSDLESMKRTLLSVTGQDILLRTDKDGNTSLLFLRRISENSADSPVILIHLDSSIMNGMVNNVKNYTFCDLNFLLNNSRTYLYPASDQLMQFSEADSLFTPAQSLKRVSQRGKDTISYISSQYFGLTFVLRTPWNASGYEMAKINLYFLGGLFLLIIGGILLTKTFIRTNYRPVKELLDLAADVGYLPSAENFSSSFNEYAVLKEALYSSRDHSQSMQELLTSQEEQLKRSLLSLLIQNSGAAVQKPEYLALTKKFFPYKYIRMAILITDKNGVNSSAISFPEQTERLFLEFLVNTNFADGSSYYAYFLKDAEHITLFFNQEDKEESVQDSLLHHILKAFTQQLCKEHQELEDNIIYSVSAAHTCTADISAAYQEAEHALRYRIIFGEDFQQSDQTYIPSLPITKSFYYPAEVENRLLNAIITGDGELAKRIFNEVWQLNTIEYKIASEYLYFLLSDIMSTIIRTGNMVPLATDISEYIFSTSRKMMEEHSVEKIRHELLILIHEVSCVYQKEHNRSSERLKQKIYDYIEKNYANPELNVESISEVFGKSRTNLFLLFKDETGNSLLYHINRIRITHAKELLRTTKKTVGVIAEETGFISAVNFTRVFKKYTSLTPGKYRELDSE